MRNKDVVSRCHIVPSFKTNKKIALLMYFPVFSDLKWSLFFCLTFHVVWKGQQRKVVKTGTLCQISTLLQWFHNLYLAVLCAWGPPVVLHTCVGGLFRKSSTLLFLTFTSHCENACREPRQQSVEVYKPLYLYQNICVGQHKCKYIRTRPPHTMSNNTISDIL